jgi:hypothetical protein
MRCLTSFRKRVIFPQEKRKRGHSGFGVSNIQDPRLFRGLMTELNLSVPFFSLHGLCRLT